MVGCFKIQERLRIQGNLIVTINFLTAIVNHDGEVFCALGSRFDHNRGNFGSRK